MYISPMQKNELSFNARLFNPRGKEILDFPKNFKNFEMKLRGSFATDIFINKIEGSPRENILKYTLTLDNPLFNKQTFYFLHIGNKQNPMSRSEWLNLEVLTGSNSNYCKDLENKALWLKIQEIQRKMLKMHKSDDDLDKFLPRNILKNLLKTVPSEKHGFDQKRIDEFYNVANDMQLEMVKKSL